MISSRADFLFFSALESKPEDVSFFLVDDAAALRALALRAELQGVTIRVRPNNSTMQQSAACMETSVPQFGRTGYTRRGAQVESNCREM